MTRGATVGEIKLGPGRKRRHNKRNKRKGSGSKLRKAGNAREPLRAESKTSWDQTKRKRKDVTGAGCVQGRKGRRRTADTEKRM